MNDNEFKRVASVFPKTMMRDDRVDGRVIERNPGRLSSQASTYVAADGTIKIQDSPLVTETVRRIRERQSRASEVPLQKDSPMALLLKSERLHKFSQEGSIPLSEELVVVPRVKWDLGLTLRGLFSIKDSNTRWNAVKLSLRKAWAIVTFRWR